MRQRRPRSARMRRGRVLAAALAVLAAGAVGGVVVTRAEATAPSTSISGCFDTKTGALRLLTSDSPSCTASEAPLSWNEGQVATRWYRDWDGDGYGDWYLFVDSPAQPPGYVANNTDCNDNTSDTNPGQTKDPGRGDRDCDGMEAEDRVVTWYRDADGDGWGAGATVKAPMSAQPKGYVYRRDDCNDSDAKIHPYQVKCHANGDIDGDGHRSSLVGGDDCNDMDPNTAPGFTEVTDDYGHDEDCDPTTGGVVPYDPHFLDLRQHTIPGVTYSQPEFGPTGHVVIHQFTGGDPTGTCHFANGCGLWSTPPLYPA